MRLGNGPGLVVVVDDLRIPHVIELPRHRLRLDLREHRPVAVVVVADVVVIDVGRRSWSRTACRGSSCTSRATMSRPSGFIDGISTRMALSRTRFASSDSDDTSHHASSGVCCAPATSVACRPPSIQTMTLPSFASARASGSLTPRASGQPPRDLLVARAVLQVGFARDDRDDHLPTLRALADALDDDAIGRGVELREVVEQLFVAGELVVGAGLRSRRRPSAAGTVDWRAGVGTARASPACSPAASHADRHDNQ